jgi:hypothetical protein
MNGIKFAVVSGMAYCLLGIETLPAYAEQLYFEGTTSTSGNFSFTLNTDVIGVEEGTRLIFPGAILDFKFQGGGVGYESLVPPGSGFTPSVGGTFTPDSASILDLQGIPCCGGGFIFATQGDTQTDILLGFQQSAPLPISVGLPLPSSPSAYQLKVGSIEYVPVGNINSVLGQSQSGESGSIVTIVNSLTVTTPPPAQSVPEPLTILGSATALGFGVLLKREYSRKQKKS